MDVGSIRFDQDQREEMAERAERVAMAVQSRAGMMTAEDWQELRSRFANPFEADTLALFGGLQDHYRETEAGLVPVTWRDMLGQPSGRAAG